MLLLVGIEEVVEDEDIAARPKFEDDVVGKTAGEAEGWAGVDDDKE